MNVSKITYFVLGGM